MKKEVKFYYVYIITNLILNKQYVGSRMCYKDKIEDDDYWGSSKYLNEDYIIYGKENFTKEILKRDYKYANEMLNGESEYMHIYNTFTPNGYNRFDPIERIGFHTNGLKTKGFSGKNHSDESRKIMKEKATGHSRTAWNKGITLSATHIKKLKKLKTKEHKENLSKSLKRRLSPIKGIPKSEKHKQNLRKPKLQYTSIHLHLLRTGKKRGKYKKHKENIHCPYCNKNISANMYARWHGENCKHKPQI
jgi:hypothetical protein